MLKLKLCLEFIETKSDVMLAVKGQSESCNVNSKKSDAILKAVKVEMQC
jgi:hypothetical protein